MQSVEHTRRFCDKGEFDISHDVTLVVMNAVLSESNYRKLLSGSLCRSYVFTDTTFGKEISPDIAKEIMRNTEK